MNLALLQFTAEQYANNFRFLFYGLTSIWLALLVFVVMLARRERRLSRELERVRMMLEEKQQAHQSGA
jgi:CcmD family protein